MLPVHFDAFYPHVDLLSTQAGFDRVREIKRYSRLLSREIRGVYNLQTSICKNNSEIYIFNENIWSIILSKIELASGCMNNKKKNITWNG